MKASFGYGALWTNWPPNIRLNHISAFKYDETAEILGVMFHRTGGYRYFEAPLDVVEGLRESSSKGRYMRSVIIDMYDYEKRRR